MTPNNRPDSDALTTVQPAPINDPVPAEAPTHRKTNQTKCTITLDANLLGRARAAFLTHGIACGYTSFSAWIAAAIATAVSGVENDTGALPPLDPGHLPTGRLPQNHS